MPKTQKSTSHWSYCLTASRAYDKEYEDLTEEEKNAVILVQADKILMEIQRNLQNTEG